MNIILKEKCGGSMCVYQEGQENKKKLMSGEEEAF